MKKNFVTAALILVLGLGLRLGLLYRVVSSGATPLQASPQAIEYVLLGKGLLRESGWAANYFVARPPLMPLLIAGVYGTLGESEILVAVINCLLGAATGSLAFFYAKQLLNHYGVALVAGLLVAIDPASIVTNINLQAETLTNFYLVLGAWQLAGAVQAQNWRTAMLAGLWFGLAALARPTTVYFYLLSVPLFIILVKNWPRLFLAFAVLPTVLLLGWCARNYYFWGEFTYSSVSDFNLLFYRAVSVERLATGKTDDLIRREFSLEIEHRLGNTFELDQIDSGYYWNNFAPQDSRRVKIMRAIAWEVYLAHPFEYGATIPVGVYRMYAYTGFYGAPFWPELIYNLGLYALGILGAFSSWWRKVHLTLVLNGLLIGYVTLVTLISQTSGMDTRMRTSITFALATLAAVGIGGLWERLGRSGGNRSGLVDGAGFGQRQPK